MPAWARTVSALTHHMKLPGALFGQAALLNTVVGSLAPYGRLLLATTVCTVCFEHTPPKWQGHHHINSLETEQEWTVPCWPGDCTRLVASLHDQLTNLSPLLMASSAAHLALRQQQQQVFIFNETKQCKSQMYTTCTDSTNTTTTVKKNLAASRPSFDGLKGPEQQPCSELW